MSDQPINVPLQASIEGLGNVLSGLAEIKQRIGSIAELDPKGQISKQLSEVKTSVGSLYAELDAVGKSYAKNMAKSIADGAKSGADQAVRTAKEAVQQMQRDYEAVHAAGTVKIEALKNLKSAGVKLFPDDTMRVKQDALQARSAGKFTEDDFRALMGYPSRDESKTFAAQIKSQMSDSFGTEKLRVRSASKFTEDDFRSMMGYPSRDEMKSFSAQLKAGMVEDVAGIKAIEAEIANTSKLRARSAGRFTVDDFRALNGLPSRDETKTFSAQLKAQMEEDAASLRTNNRLRARSATPYTINDYRAMMGMPSEEQARGMSAQIRAQMEAEANSNLAAVRRQVSVATASPSGAFSVSEGASLGQLRGMAEAQAALNGKIGEGISPTRALAAEKAKLSAEMRNLHSASRGLASGFGAMWLTWGNILPLMAGAGLSAAVVQMVKAGGDVQQSLTTMRVLGGESESAIAGLNLQMLELAKTGPFGPREIADAMKVLTLAGMSANEVSASLKDTLNFSVAGDTGIQQAADTLTTVAKAFGVGSGSSGMAGGFAYVGDIISKAAAESKASVEDMSNSFKTASAINQQFGVTLEDTAVGLALLANAGIKGTAAGTSLRNMVSDLSGRTKHAAAAMKELGVEAIDPATGKIKSLDLVMGSLMEKLQKQSSPAGALKYLQTIFDERGAKEAYAMFDALQTKSKETGDSVTTVYAELKDKILNAGGFAAIAAAEMALTPLNQMKSVAATLQATLVETFDSLQPYLIETAVHLRDVFSSEGFKSGLQDLAVMVGNLTSFVTEHARAITGVVLAYVGLRSVVAIMTELRAASMAMAAANAAMGASAAAAGVAVTELGIASRIAVAGNPLLLALSAAITAAAVGWGIYEMTLGSVDKVAKDASAGHKEMIRNLELERDRLKDVNEARALNITLEEYKATKKPSTNVDSAQEANIAELQRRLANAKLVDKSSANVIQAELDAAVNNLNGERQARIRAQYQLKAEAGRLADSQRKELADRQAEIGSRFKGTSTGPADTAKGHGPNDNSLAQISKQYDTEMSLIKALEGDKLKLLNAQRSANLLSQEGFYASEIQLADSTAAREIAQIEKSSAEYIAAWDKKYSDIQKSSAKNKGELISNLINEGLSADAKFNADREKLQADSNTRKILQEIAFTGRMKKIRDDYRDYTIQVEADDAKKARKVKSEDALRFLSPEGAVRQGAASDEYERIASVVQDYETKIRKLNDALADDIALAAASGERTAEQNAALEAQTANVERLTAEYRKYQDLVKAGADARAKKAGQDAMDRADKEALKPVADQMRKALSEGIKNGFREGESVIDIFGKALGDQVESRMAKAFMESTVDPLVKMAMDALSNLIRDSVSGLGGKGFGGTGDFLSSAWQWLVNANGNAFGSGGVHAFANGGAFTNGIYNQPTPFLFASGGTFRPGVMGEAGDEAVMPLKRGPGGQLGVQASGMGGGSNVVVNVIESPGNGGKQNRRTENGVDVIDIMVEKVKSSIAGDISKGTGAVPSAMASTYGLNRVAGAY